MKSIPHSCCITFCHTLKESLYKVIIKSRSIGACVQFPFHPCCTLQMIKPQIK